MKKSITIFIILTILSSFIFAQTAIPQKGDKIAGLKLALDKAGTADLGFLGTFELGATDDVLNLDGMPTSFGYGGTVGFSSNDHTYWTSNTLLVGGNGYFHIDVLGNDKLDTYATLFLGIHRWSINLDNDYDGMISDNSETDFVTDFYLGARYYFTEALAAVVELGTGFGTIHLGVDFALGR